LDAIKASQSEWISPSTSAGSETAPDLAAQQGSISLSQTMNQRFDAARTDVKLGCHFFIAGRSIVLNRI
jgi:hypothetical protein